MGQLLTINHIPQLPIQIQQSNIQPQRKHQRLIICPFLKCKEYKKIFFNQSDTQIEVIYKFGNDYTVYLQLKKQKCVKKPGIPIKLANQYVYAYKHKKLQKSQKIYPDKIFFKKRIYAYEYDELQQVTLKVSQQKNDRNSIQSQSIMKKKIKDYGSKQQLLLKKFAEIKFLSLRDLGPQLGRVHNGNDGIITQQYIEYFSQITIEKIQNCIPKNSQLIAFQQKLNSYKLDGKQLANVQNLTNLAYSHRRKGYLFKQIHYHQRITFLSNTQLSYENKSIHYLVRMFQTQINQAIMELDNQAKMLPYINNLIFQNQYQKAISKMQENLNQIHKEQDRLEYAEEVSIMISKQSQGNSSIYNKSYQKRLKKIMQDSGSRSISGSGEKQKQNNQLFNQKKRKQLLSIYKTSLTQSNQQKQTYEKQQYQTQLQNQAKPSIKTKFITFPISSQRIIQQSNEKQINDKIIQNSQNHKKNHNLYLLSSYKEKRISRSKQKNSFKMTMNFQDHIKKKFQILKKMLKNSILDKNKTKALQILKEIYKLSYKSQLQVQIIYCKLLMENGKSRHALTILQRLLYYSNQAPPNQIYFYYEISLLAGLINYQRQNFIKALKNFEKSLSILITLHHYSIKMMIVYNNISCILHILKNYDKSLLNLHRGFKLGQYSADFEYLMRSNMAMSLVQKGKIKQAKQQLLKINKIIEPVNNMVIFCKFYSNWAYLQLIETNIGQGNGKDNNSYQTGYNQKDSSNNNNSNNSNNTSSYSKLIQKSLSTFEQACCIEQKYLIPNGYKPSIFLHNNMSMIYYKRRQYKKAKYHCEKIIPQLHELNDYLMGIKVHFNIGKIFSHGYNYDIPLKHFYQAKILLSKMDQRKDKCIKKYKQIILKQIDQLERMRIDQVSQDQSYKLSLMSGSLLMKKG